MDNFFKSLKFKLIFLLLMIFIVYASINLQSKKAYATNICASKNTIYLSHIADCVQNAQIMLRFTQQY